MTWLRRGLIALGILGGVWTALPVRLSGLGAEALAKAATPRDAAEIRALWVTRSSLTTPASITALVKTAHDEGFNTLLVQVRGRADAYYTTDLEPRAADLARQPSSFDPLATVLAEARARGIRVHAWVSVNLVSSAAELPASPDHLVYRHPEWLMVPRTIAQELAHLDPANPGYVGKIARWTRGQNVTIEGLYASSRTWRAATISTACTWTTRATRTSSSTTAASRSRSSGPTSARGSRPTRGARSTRRRTRISSPTPISSRPSGRRSGARASPRSSRGSARGCARCGRPHS
jgi:hypothetical protein